VLKKEPVNKIEALDIRRDGTTQRKIKYNANKKAQEKSKKHTKKHNANKKT